MGQTIEEISDFLLGFKNRDVLENEIIEYKDQIKAYAHALQANEAFEQYKDKYLALRGYAYRLDNAKLRLYYSFKESVESFNLAKLAHNQEESLAVIYSTLPLLDICIDEMLGLDVNEEEKELCKDIYANQMKELSTQSKKYHMYQ
ncbi:MAG: hypothetical protein ACNI3C_12430 [Candidatus Marinarcus sp.]|uniref:hypothetical protein n=1 Tax=Candidatus Marinarcus sp. TaxID=3100987 RepID=UPI003AFF6E01